MIAIRPNLDRVLRDHSIESCWSPDQDHVCAASRRLALMHPMWNTRGAAVRCPHATRPDEEHAAALNVFPVSRSGAVMTSMRRRSGSPHFLSPTRGEKETGGINRRAQPPLPTSSP